MKSVFRVAIIVFLLAGITFSFLRYRSLPIDGDLPYVALPHAKFDPLFNDPLGIKLLFTDAQYESPNRFFAHWLISTYFRNVPLALQYFSSPIDSIYLSAALAQSGVQLLLIYLFAAYITGKRKPWDHDLLLAAAMVFPMFQLYGFYSVMGIVDRAVTYTFCYALALGLVMVFFLPYFDSTIRRRPFKPTTAKVILLGILALIISFNGPLNPPVILLICCSSILYQVATSSSAKPLTPRKIPAEPLTYLFGLAIVFSLYSLYVGTHNSAEKWAALPVLERYARLPMGLLFQFTDKPALPLILLMTGVNILILSLGFRSTEGCSITKLVKWMLFASATYILTLPLGGYRAYRPNIVRYDTFMPITFAIIVCYGLSSFWVHKRLSGIPKYIHFAGIAALAVFFVHSDFDYRPENVCERSALSTLSDSDETIVELKGDCSILGWGKLHEYEKSAVKTELLRHWNVIEAPKFFFQE